jgi:hypothetical protein
LFLVENTVTNKENTVKKGLTLCLIVALTAPLLWAQQVLPITRVLLYKNGMAYIVRGGQITTPLSLTFHPEDMNDILKSFTAWNPDTGALYSVGYTTGIPSSHMLGRFPFDISGSDIGLGGFLTQVKGAEIRLDVSGKNLEGKLAAVQKADHVISQQTLASDYRLTVLLKDGSLQTVWMSDVKSVEFVDAQLRDQLRSYLAVLSEGRQDVTREVSIYPVPASGPIRVGYLQQFPLWKTSYRVDLGEKDSKVQGWAQIDNPTGESWNNVEVSLLSGAPVSFVMNLYAPLYTNRSTVAVPGGQVAAPRQYESATSVFDNVAGLAVPQAAAAAPAGGARGGGGGRGGPAAPQLAQQAANRSAQEQLSSALTFQQATGTEVGDMFEYKFPFPVQLASRQSALLPFLQKSMNIERLSIFNARSDRSNPRLGARFENNTEIPIEPGPVTFFEDGRYAGEAVLEYLARSEKRLVSYGIDNDIQIAGKQQSKPETTVRMTVAKGVAVLFMESLLTTNYEIRNKGTLKKNLIVEHPRIGDRKLKDAQPIEATDSFYRFRVALTAGQATELPVQEIVGRQTTVALQSLSRNQLVLFSGKETPAAVREKLGQIVDTQEQIASLRDDLRTTQQTIDTTVRDQDRLRENMKALRDTREEQELRTRYLNQLKMQEDLIDSSRSHIESVNRSIAAAEARLADMISNLTYGN